MSARGSTIVESLIAVSILLPMLAVGYSTSWSALESSADAAAESEESAEDGRLFDRLGDLLRPASRAHLQASPCSGECEVEEMLDYYIYDNVHFRHVASVGTTTTRYDPPLEQDPWVIEFEPDEVVGEGQEQRGDVVWTHGGRRTVLAQDCTGALFWKDDDLLTMYIYWLEGSEHRVLYRSYLLRTP